MRRAPFAQGLFYVVTGLWPVIHLRSFEAVAGRKRDRWLVQTTGALIAAIGVSLLVAARDRNRAALAEPANPDDAWRPSDDGTPAAVGTRPPVAVGTGGNRAVKTMGIASAATLAVADVYFVASGQIPRVYLADAAAEAALIGLWILD
jgi:hypothetical protein